MNAEIKQIDADGRASCQTFARIVSLEDHLTEVLLKRAFGSAQKQPVQSFAFVQFVLFVV